MGKYIIKYLVHLLLILLLSNIKIGTSGQNTIPTDSLQQDAISRGWVEEGISIGYFTAPAVVGLMFISSLLSEWNAGYVGIPAAAMILTAPPLIFTAGRSVDILEVISQPRARLGWTLYALSIVPTSVALYGFTTQWGATLPITIASGILGSASIIAMTTYAFSRNESADMMEGNNRNTIHLGVSPLPGGAMATMAIRF